MVVCASGCASTTPANPLTAPPLQAHYQNPTPYPPAVYHATLLCTNPCNPTPPPHPHPHPLTLTSSTPSLFRIWFILAWAGTYNGTTPPLTPPPTHHVCLLWAQPALPGVWVRPRQTRQPQQRRGGLQLEGARVSGGVGEGACVCVRVCVCVCVCVTVCKQQNEVCVSSL